MKGRMKRKISIVFVLILLLGVFPVYFIEKTEVKAAESDYELNNPRIDSDGVTTSLYSKIDLTKEGKSSIIYIVPQRSSPR